jgi:hypothetical protein
MHYLLWPYVYKVAPCSFSATFSTNCPAVHLDDLTHNRQPQTKSTTFSRAGAIGLAKTVKD